MIKCYFVDVNSISSDLPRSSFEESELEQIANLILATDGLLRPLILKESGVEKYTVVEGHREYYAALKAKEKDSRKAEMVNAFLISPQIQQSAIEQLSLLNEEKYPIVIPAIDPIDAIVEKLLPTLLSTVSQLIQPMVVQLDEQKKILDKFTIDLSEIRQLLTPKPPYPIIPSTEANALSLVNSLDLDGLTLRMTQSGITSAKKLATNIIAARNTQPEQKFETWEIVTAKVKGLGAATTQKIMDKLK